MKEALVEVEGTLVAKCKSGFFQVRLASGDEIITRISNRMVQHHIKLSVGDRVAVEMSPYDVRRGRITYRLE
jgi:translation initiation factor IF-1